MKGCVFLDAGGTQIKSAAFSAEGERLGPIRTAASHAKEDKDAILSNFLAAIEEGKQCLLSAGRSLSAVGFAFPGPFDFREGISRMQGLDKYDSIYGLPLREALAGFPGQRTLTPGIRLFFRHDMASFALGEAYRSMAGQTRRILCLCIGTGAGSAFLEDGELLTADPRVPEHGWIYASPFRGASIDDWVSARGLGKLAADAGFEDGITGKDLYLMASQGNIAAGKVWNAFGETIAEAIVPFVRSFKPQQLLFGGQIAGALAFFGPAVQAAFPELPFAAVPDTTKSTFRGLYRAMEEDRLL